MNTQNLLPFMPGTVVTNIDTSAWEDSVVVFGNIDQDELRNFESLGIPVIGISCPGSFEFQMHNNLILAEYYTTPLAVVNIWGDMDNLTYYHDAELKEDWVQHLTERNAGGLLDRWLRGSFNRNLHNYFNALAVKQVWYRTKYYSCSTFESVSEVIKCDFVEEWFVNKTRVEFGSLTKNI